MQCKILLLILYFVRDISCLSFSALSQHSLLFESHVFHVGFFCRFNEDDCNENHIGAKLSSWALFRCTVYMYNSIYTEGCRGQDLFGGPPPSEKVFNFLIALDHSFLSQDVF